MKGLREIFLVLSLFLVLVLGFWAEALPPDRTLFLRDLSIEIIPLRDFWARSGGFALWNPYSFFGIPYAANPQNQAFYPFNFFYLLFGSERGLIYFIIFHHWFFLFTFYLALRKLGFQRESSVIGALGFGFGGFLCSLSLLMVLLSTISWFPLVVICLNRAIKKGWITSGVLLGPVIALQVLAGEIELAGMSWFLAICAVALVPTNRVQARFWQRLFASFGLGIFFGAILSAVQWILTLELIPLSNRASGFSLNDALLWSFQPFQLMSLIIPNYILPVFRLPISFGSYWGLGFFSEFPYFLSFYPGIIVLLMAILSFWGKRKWENFFWLGMALASLGMAMGHTLPFYKFFYYLIPFFRLFRFPVKFLFLFYFAFIMLAVSGFEQMNFKGRKILALLFFLSGILVVLYLIFYPLHLPERALSLELLAGQFFLRAGFRGLALLLLSLALIFLGSQKRKSWLGAGLGLLIFLDLFFSHRFLNLPIPRSFYHKNIYLQNFLKQARMEKYPPRILSLYPPLSELDFNRRTDPIKLFARMRDGLENFIPIYFGINDLRAYSLFCPLDIGLWEKLLDKGEQGHKKLLLGRAGVEQLYYRDTGFIPQGELFSRAMIFYQARFIPDREQVLEIFPEPNFPALKVVLLEGFSEEASTASESLFSERAEVISYENERVVIEAEAKEDGWLLLLDSYYPGWQAEVDGKAVPIYRANGFFRAVKISQGRHKIIFSYFPWRFKEGIIISGTGFLVWLFLLGLSLKIRKGQR